DYYCQSADSSGWLF
nr:immunoglobulin light chain junction region [Macaca mulatta]MOW04170.1 immunoglobulin light chain junction region [Macaca mulatta]MOW04442.1 immunoglobulin light chain junction region [Macaca mulatta]MOW04506.1 immunoglobulin light chain junction region [Macaca mulatta]MOW04591.1 immunoglobulin light chain junction region [Macaca mulatta]